MHRYAESVPEERSCVEAASSSEPQLLLASAESSGLCRETGLHPAHTQTTHKDHMVLCYRGTITCSDGRWKDMVRRWMQSAFVTHIFHIVAFYFCHWKKKLDQFYLRKPTQDNSVGGNSILDFLVYQRFNWWERDRQVTSESCTHFLYAKEVATVIQKPTYYSLLLFLTQTRLPQHLSSTRWYQTNDTDRNHDTELTVLFPFLINPW